MNILVVDDEALARRRLVGLVAELGDPWVVAGEAANGEEAFVACEKQSIDVVLMDIHMPGMDGLEVAERLAARPIPPAVIFVTAYSEHALSAFEAHAVDYLLKPVRREKLRQALGKITRLTRPLLKQGNGSEEVWLTSRYRGGLQRIPFSSVYYFRADSKYVVVRHADGEALLEESLKTLERRFADNLLRIHRSALVAPRHVKGLERNQDGTLKVVFSGIEDHLDVSRRHLPQVKRMLQPA